VRKLRFQFIYRSQNENDNFESRDRLDAAFFAEMAIKKG
jgi:hypothetical protein